MPLVLQLAPWQVCTENWPAALYLYALIATLKIALPCQRYQQLGQLLGRRAMLLVTVYWQPYLLLMQKSLSRICHSKKAMKLPSQRTP